MQAIVDPFSGRKPPSNALISDCWRLWHGHCFSIIFKNDDQSAIGTGSRRRMQGRQLNLAQPGPRREVFRWMVRIVRVPQLQLDPRCSFIPRKIKSDPSKETFFEGL